MKNVIKPKKMHKNYKNIKQTNKKKAYASSNK